MNLASWVTLSRLSLLPPAMLCAWHGRFFAAAVLTIAAGITDMLDGYLARISGGSTALGANLDLLADKLFISGMLSVLWLQGTVPLWALAVIVGREIAVTVVRRARLRGGATPVSDAWGKSKMAVSVAAVAMLLLKQDLSQGGPISQTGSLAPAFSWLLGLAPWALAAAVGLTIVSGANYLATYLRPALPEKPPPPGHTNARPG